MTILNPNRSDDMFYWSPRALSKDQLVQLFLNLVETWYLVGIGEPLCKLKSSWSKKVTQLTWKFHGQFIRPDWLSLVVLYCFFFFEWSLRNLDRTCLQIDKISSSTPVARCQCCRLATIETKVHHSHLVKCIPDDTLLLRQPSAQSAFPWIYREHQQKC